MPVPPIAPKDDIDSCGLSLSELMELWLGVGHNGSLFRDEDELRAAWARGRSVVMRLWGRGARRPQAWWYLEGRDLGLQYPGYYRERSYLYEAGVLSEAERGEVEREWRQAYDAARGKNAKERRAHFEHHDIPDELIRVWAGTRRRRSGAVLKKAPDEASTVGSDDSGASLAQPADH